MDLKSFRENKLKLATTAEFAKLLNVDEQVIIQAEMDSNKCGLPLLERIREKTGVSLDELISWEKPKPKPLSVTNTWEKANYTKHTLGEYVSSALAEMSLPEEQYNAYVIPLIRCINSIVKKPKVAIVGRSDTGKSTLINALIGSEKMPTSWTPTTSIAVYIKDISDRPSFITEDAWIFASQRGNEKKWDESRLNDESYCRNWLIGSGGVEMLCSYGTRQGEYYAQQAGSAVVFLDAPILKTCDIVDLPGFGTETEKDDEITFSETKNVDVIVYLCQANAFMRVEDGIYLKRNITELPVLEKRDENDLPPLANLFIVASQAHTINCGNRSQLATILDTGCQNLLKTLPEGYWDAREATSGFEYSDDGYTELRNRFFTYSTDIPDVCEAFNHALKCVLEELPRAINIKVKAIVRQYAESRTPNISDELQKYEALVSERDKYVDLLHEIDENEISRIEDNDQQGEEMRAEIKRLRVESVSEFSDYTAELMNIDSLVSRMKHRGIKNRQEDVELFASSLQGLIQAKCEKILLQKSGILSQKAADYITAFSQNIAKPFENNSLKADFDAGWAFASALAKLGTIGGFGAFLASSASGAVMLAGLGLSAGASILGGVFASSLFGPLGIAFGLLLTIGLGLVSLFGGWRKNVAKKIVNAFEEQQINEKFHNAIKQYWEQTEDAFDKAAAALDKDWGNYVSGLRDTVENYDIEEIERKMAGLRNLTDFFANIPL